MMQSKPGFMKQTKPGFGVQSKLDSLKAKLKTYAGYAAIGGTIFLLISLMGNISKIQDSIKVVEKKEKDVALLQAKNEELKKQLERVNELEFVEEQIRNQLGLAREGEVVLVLPEDEILRKLVPDLPSEEQELPDPNWKKWMKLFL